MELADLLALYQQDQRTNQITQGLENGHQRLLIEGASGSLVSMIAASVFKTLSYNHLVIATEQEEAAYLQNDLSNLLDKKDILFFPDSYKKPGRLTEVDKDNILFRTEAVNKLMNSDTKGEIIVTYSEALFEKVVQPSQLEESIVQIKVGEKLDAPFITEVLVHNGFEHTDFVYEPGQFSVRGGIIDIFSFGNDYPFRVELFAEEVESIRTFDPTTQLSEKKLNQVSIVPNIQTQFKNDQKTSLLRLMPENTIIWTKDARFNFDIIQQCFEQALTITDGLKENQFDPEHDNPVYQDQPAHVFETPQTFLDDIQTFPVIEYGGKSYFESDLTIRYDSDPQPSFNKNFDMLISTLQENEEKGYQNFIFAENPKQHNRFQHIFDDLDAEVTYNPITKSIHEGFIDKDLRIACYTDHQIFNRYHRYNLKKGFSKSEAMLLKTLKELTPGDYVTHIDHGVGVYSGLEKINVNGQTQEVVRLKYKDNDLLYVNVNSIHKISKYVNQEGTAPSVNKLGSGKWESVKRKTKKKIKDIADQLIRLYAKRKAKKGFAFSPDSYLQTELEASFEYEDTPDQLKATQEVKEDMEADYPMDRLICGDVGFGKTEIAIRAAFKAVAESKQVAVLAPTTILTLQHYKTFAERLKDFPCNVEFLNRFKSQKEKTDILKRLKEGKIDILIGTHSIIGKNVNFHDLGLLIIDEEQKFGVSAKEKLRELKINVDTLTLTATPIPRTLQFSLMGARDLSIIQTPPPNRQPIQTELHPFSDDVLKDAIEYEVYRGGQVYFIHNRVQEIEAMGEMLRRICPDIEFKIAHGQMDGKELEKIMTDFINHEFDVLLSTNIVENGLDIPNVNTIIINNAHKFGLSDLHQLRGRVGRMNRKAFCYLFSPPLSTLPDDARKRLKTIEEFSDLGSGFSIAMRDLDIRGAGNLLGGEQSGFIAEIGFETYQKILDESIQELKETEFKDLYQEELEKKQEYVRDCQIDSDMEVWIPDDYVNSVNERLKLYTELDHLENEEQLQAFKEKLVDRFGPLPDVVEALFDTIRIRWAAKQLGFERIILKNGEMKGYFIAKQDSPFYQSATFGNIMQYIQENQNFCNLKQTEKYLILTVNNINAMADARSQLQTMVAATAPAAAEAEKQ